MIRPLIFNIHENTQEAPSIYILQDENVYIIYFDNMAQNCQILRIKYCQILIFEFHYYQMICKNLIMSGIIIINIRGFVICETPNNFSKFNTIENFLLNSRTKKKYHKSMKQQFPSSYEFLNYYTAYDIIYLVNSKRSNPA